MEIFTWWLVGGLVAGLASLCFYCVCVAISKFIDLIIGGVGK